MPMGAIPIRFPIYTIKNRLGDTILYPLGGFNML